MSGHLIIELAQGDTIQLRGRANIRPDGGTYSLWSGYLMHAPATHSSSGSVTSTSPTGMIASFGMETPPDGWHVCNGGEYSITSYSELYAVIGTTWGELTDGSGGSGDTHFRVPDLRGEFLRGFDNAAGNDPDASDRTGGDAVGSSQSQGIPRLFGSWGDNHGNARQNVFNQTGHSGTQAIYGSGTTPWRQSIESDTGHHSYVNLDSSLVIPHGSDVRPRNKNVQFCIKY